MYFQLAFAIDRVKAMAPQHPEWKDKDPFKSLLAGDMKGVLAGGEHALARDRHGRAREHDAGRVRARLPLTGSPPPGIRPPVAGTARWCTSRCSNCSPTCAPTASRPSSCRAVASIHARLHGTGLWCAARAGDRQHRQAEVRDAQRRTHAVQDAAVDFVDDKDGKPIAIHRHIGRRPIVASHGRREPALFSGGARRPAGPANAPLPDGGGHVVHGHRAAVRRLFARRTRLDRPGRRQLR